MSHPAPAHFESHGSIERVRKEIERYLPILVPDLPCNFVDSLYDLIQKYSDQYHWDIIVLDISRGLARHVLDDLTQIEMHAKNGIIIDPCGSTPEHTIVESEKVLKINRERLVIANESTDDLLVVLYGIDEINRHTDFELLKRHLRLIGASMDALPDNLEETIEDTIKRDELISQRNKKILETRFALEAFSKNIKNLEENPNDDSALFGANGTLFMLYVTLTSLQFMPETDLIEDRLEFLIQQVRLMPNFFESIAIDLDPYIEAALGVSENERRYEEHYRKTPKLKQKKTYSLDPTPVALQNKVLLEKTLLDAREPTMKAPQFLSKNVDPE